MVATNWRHNSSHYEQLALRLPRSKPGAESATGLDCYKLNTCWIFDKRNLITNERERT